MKIAIFTVGGVFSSSIILNRLIESRSVDVTCVVESSTKNNKMKLFRSLVYVLKKSGLPFIMHKIAEYLIYKIGSHFNFLFRRKKPKRMLSARQMCWNNKLPFLKSDNINSKEVESFIKSQKPDVIVLASFNQIIKKNILKVPKKGIINFHPGLLPNYKGINAYFWAMFRKEKYAGLTVHFVDEKIDNGKIITQKRIKIKRGESAFSLHIRMAIHGAESILLALKRIRTGVMPKYDRKKKGAYFSIPTKDVVTKFRKRRKLFDFKTAIKLVRGKKIKD